ncbi:hypothetical protein BKH41_01840 [Helicobacter sp. 12S02232-10]|nr:hypothetical protein BKH41_01840 [Helicobacter sp. 12S02232-10]
MTSPPKQVRSNEFKPKAFTDLTLLPLHKILLCNGFKLNKDSSSVNNPVVFNDNDKLVICKKEGHYLYFNTDGSNDRGNIINFCKHRGVNVSDLIKNYENGNVDLESHQIPQYFNSELNSAQTIKKFNEMSAYNRNNNEFFANRGLYDALINEYDTQIKLDGFGDVCFPHFKLSHIPNINKNNSLQEGELQTIQPKTMLTMCGYTKRLKFPLTKNTNGSIKEKPLKQIHYGAKGLEILKPNGLLNPTDSKQIKQIVITESIIDSLSFLQLFSNFNPKETMLIGTCGDFNFEIGLKPSLEAIMKILNPDIRIVLGFDNDTKGRKFSEEFERFILEKTKKAPMVYKPFCKDLNDDLKLSQLTGLKKLNNDSLNDFLEKQLLTYKKSSDTLKRKNILETFRKIDKYKPLKENFKNSFNEINKHKAIREL